MQSRADLYNLIYDTLYPDHKTFQGYGYQKDCREKRVETLTEAVWEHTVAYRALLQVTRKAEELRLARAAEKATARHARNYKYTKKVDDHV